MTVNCHQRAAPQKHFRSFNREEHPFSFLNAQPHENLDVLENRRTREDVQHQNERERSHFSVTDSIYLSSQNRYSRNRYAGGVTVTCGIPVTGSPSREPADTVKPITRMEDPRAAMQTLTFASNTCRTFAYGSHGKSTEYLLSNLVHVR